MTTFSLTRRALDLRFRMARLVAQSWQTEHYVRIRLQGEDLAGFDSPGCDDHIRLFFPDAPVSSVEELRQAPSREYTPFAWGEDWLEVEFVIHGEPGQRGVAAEWAATAEPGDVIGVGGPRGSLLVEGTPDAWFLAGDETAVPAIRRYLAAMPVDAVGQVVLEVPDADSELTLSGPCGVAVTVLHRRGAAEGSVLASYLEALDAADRPSGDPFLFIAAEQGIVKPGRALAVERWGLEADRIVIKGYWKRGDSEFHAPH